MVMRESCACGMRPCFHGSGLAISVCDLYSLDNNKAFRVRSSLCVISTVWITAGLSESDPGWIQRKVSSRKAVFQPCYAGLDDRCLTKQCTVLALGYVEIGKE